MVKTGVNIRGKRLSYTCHICDDSLRAIGDGNKLYRDFGIHAQHLVELSYFARAADPDAWPKDRKISKLADLVAVYTRRNLLKGDERTSNWRNPLTEKQLTCEWLSRSSLFLLQLNQLFWYVDAANDAHASLAVYNRLVIKAGINQLVVSPADVMVLIKTSPVSSTSSMETVDFTARSPSPVPLYQSAAPKRSQTSDFTGSTKYAKSSASTKFASSSYTRFEEPTAPTQSTSTQSTSTSASSLKKYHHKAYTEWHKHNYTLDQLCVRVASKKSAPIKRQTVM